MLYNYFKLLFADIRNFFFYFDLYLIMALPVTKIYYRILHLPIEDNGFYPDPSHEFYFRPWVNLFIEVEGNRQFVEIPPTFLSPEELDYFHSFEC